LIIGNLCKVLEEIKMSKEMYLKVGIIAIIISVCVHFYIQNVVGKSLVHYSYNELVEAFGKEAAKTSTIRQLKKDGTYNTVRSLQLTRSITGYGGLILVFLAFYLQKKQDKIVKDELAEEEEKRVDEEPSKEELLDNF
jgi:hypothetical protein